MYADAQTVRRSSAGTGRYRLLLARGWDTRTLRNGKPTYEVAVSDTRGNRAQAAIEFHSSDA